MPTKPDIVGISIKIVDKIAPFYPFDSVADARQRHQSELTKYILLEEGNQKDYQDLIRESALMSDVENAGNNVTFARRKICELQNQGPQMDGRRRFLGYLPLWRSKIPIRQFTA